jgi:signal transduction histidine kinase/ActR/RegA family two-component response regulator
MQPDPAAASPPDSGLSDTSWQQVAAQVPGLVYAYRLYPDGRSCFPYASEGMRQIYRLPPEAVRADASAVLRLLHPEDAARVVASIQASAADLNVWRCQYRVLHANGDVCWLLGHAKPQQLADGSTLWHGFITDISERVAVEAELARYRRGLERLVEERTHELIAARDASEQANRAKSEFLSSMSHELRTPMNAILGFAQLLELDRGLNPRSTSYVQEILRAGQHLLELINEVLDLARVESGHLTLSPEPLPLAELLHEALALVAPLAAQRGLQLGPAQLDAGAEVLLGDRLRLKQVLLNLLSNAVKYNREGGSVQVQARVMSPAQGGRVRVAVHDTGPGIEAAQLHRLFQPFSRLGQEPAGRADAAGQSAGRESTGIGLAISDRLVRVMGGRMGVESQPGVGSCFWLELPPARLADPPPTRVLATLPAWGLPPTGRRARVLYVEDNPANLKLVEQIIARHPGLELLTAPSGRLGLDLARAHQPELLLLDLDLPDLDGYQVLAQLRADPATRGLRTVAVTAQAMPSDQQRVARAGFDGYLAKPLELARVDEMLVQLLAGPASPPAGAPPTVPAPPPA